MSLGLLRRLDPFTRYSKKESMPAPIPASVAVHLPVTTLM